MISLKDFNAERLKMYAINTNGEFPRNNGIACPRCEGELSDVKTSVMLLSNPPMFCVECDNCHFRSYRYA